MSKSYTIEQFEAMRKLFQEFKEVGQEHEFTVGTIQRRLRVGRVKALDIFVDLMEEAE